MSTLHVTNDTFDTVVLGSDVPVLVDFFAPWCAPCKMLGPIIDEIAEEYSGTIKVAKVDIEEERDLALQCGVRSVPTLLYFKDGKVVHKSVGVKPKQVLIQELGL